MSVKQLTDEINIQKWSALIEERRNSGMKVIEWCKSRGFTKHQYYYWQKKICDSVCNNLSIIKETKNTSNIPAFEEIRANTINNTNNIAMTVIINSTSVQIHNNANEETILAALRIIKIL